MTDNPIYRALIWSTRSRHDLDGIRAYIGLYAPKTAFRFTARLIAAVESLAEYPDRGRRVGDLRELVAISPYIVRYRVTSEAVEIVTIWHGATRIERTPDGLLN